MNIPPDGRLDGPVHEWFSLSYANYQVIPRTLMQSMPVGWQQRIVGCLRELDDAFRHIEQPDAYDVTPARESYYNELDPADMAYAEVTTCQNLADTDHPVDCLHYYDRDGDEHDGNDRVLIPDHSREIPHYQRGRTYLEPAPFLSTAAAHMRVRWMTLGGHIHATVWSTTGAPDTTHGNNGRLIFRPEEFDLFRDALSAQGVEFIEDQNWAGA